MKLSGKFAFPTMLQSVAWHERCVRVARGVESVFIIGSKLYHFFCDDEKVQVGHSRSDAQLKMFTVSPQVPVILLFLT